MDGYFVKGDGRSAVEDFSRRNATHTDIIRKSDRKVKERAGDERDAIDGVSSDKFTQSTEEQWANTKTYNEEREGEDCDLFANAK